MIAINVKNLTKSFISKKSFFSKKSHLKQVLNSCSFSINEGDIFGLAGLNGIGKTTLIKIILDMLLPDTGEVEIFNTKNTCSYIRKNICYLPEKFLPSQYLTGYEYIRIFLSFYQKKIDFQKIDELVLKLDFDKSFLKQVVKKYSKGMQQKLGLLCCLLSEAKILILDEPMSGLDPKARVLLKKVLKEYAINGNTVFFSSHILDDIEEICNNMAILHNGIICFIGSPLELRKKYPSTSAEKSFLACIDNIQ